MTEQTRRGALTTALAVGAGVSALTTAFSAAAQAAASSDASLEAHAHDWDWLIGRWSVRHRRLKGRLEGSTEWEDFGGASTFWTTMGGFGNVDDNIVEIPSGAYRAMSIRAFDPATRRWAIWWLDARFPDRIEPPVFGRFENGVGLFEGDDTLRGQPIKVRFEWSDLATERPRWQQSFSPDGGATWEVNWVNWFTRIA
jgi:hypothetical protein